MWGRYRPEEAMEARLLEPSSTLAPCPSLTPTPTPTPNPNSNPSLARPLPLAPSPTPLGAAARRGLYLPYISLYLRVSPYLPYISLGAAARARPISPLYLPTSPHISPSPSPLHLPRRGCSSVASLRAGATTPFNPNPNPNPNPNRTLALTLALTVTLTRSRSRSP